MQLQQLSSCTRGLCKGAARHASPLAADAVECATCHGCHSHTAPATARDLESPVLPEGLAKHQCHGCGNYAPIQEQVHHLSHVQASKETPLIGLRGELREDRPMFERSARELWSQRSDANCVWQFWHKGRDFLDTQSLLV